MTPKDRIALTALVGLLTWGAVAIGGAVYRNKSFTEGGMEFFVGIGLALASMIGTYLLSKNNNDKPK